MYTVQIYCTVPSSVELTDDMKRHFAYHKLSAGGFTVRTFDTQDEFFHFVRGFDYKDLYNRQCNQFLDATMCHIRDARRHVHSCLFRCGHVSRYPLIPGFDYYLGYLTRDAKGRVIDLRNYTNELYTFDNDKYVAAGIATRRAEWESHCAIRNAKWEKLKRLWEGKTYWSYYRRIQTTQERRYAADPEHKPFIRRRRSFAMLPNSWDDFYFRREKSWKARVKKARRQWEVNKPKHSDTIKMSSPWDIVFDFYRR